MSGLLCVYDEAGVVEHLPEHLRALRRLSHRGPHGDGYFQSDTLFLGVARGADGNAAGSRQPLAREDGTVVAAIDGRVHNRDELVEALRARGVRADLASDPALVLAMYAQHGDAFAEHLHGVFAIVLWDARQRALFVVRDRLGVRPLYSYAACRRVLVASEIKSLLQLEPEAGAVDRERVRALIHAGLIDDWTATCFAHVRPVSPGTVVRFGGDRSSTRRYWTLCPRTDRTLTPEAIHDLLVAAVERHTPACTPVGLALSGGIDSSALAGSLARTRAGRLQTVRAFSVNPPHTFDESALIDATVRHTGIPHEHVSLADLDVPQAVARLVEAHDEPVHYSGALYQFVLRQRMAEAGCRAVLVGYGADEIFAGYRDLAPPFLAALVAGGRFADAVRFVRGAGGFVENPPRRLIAQAQAFARARARAAVIGAIKRTLHVDRCVPESGSSMPLDRPLSHTRPPPTDYDLRGVQGGRLFMDALLGCFRRNIPLLVRQEDRNAMAHGLELCAPFLDVAVVEAALAFPFHRHMEGGWNKAMLRSATRELLAPEVRAERRKLLTPGNDAHLAFDVLRGPFRELLHDRSFHDSGLWSRDAPRAYESDAARRVQGHLWFRVYMVHQWHERVVRSAAGTGSDRRHAAPSPGSPDDSGPEPSA